MEHTAPLTAEQLTARIVFLRELIPHDYARIAALQEQMREAEAALGDHLRALAALEEQKARHRGVVPQLINPYEA